MKFNPERTHGKDLDMVDPEHASREGREFDWDDLSSVPFKGKQPEASDILAQMDEVGQFGKSFREREAKLQGGLAEAQMENDEDAIEGYQAAMKMISEQHQEKPLNNQVEAPLVEQPNTKQESETITKPEQRVLASGEKSTLYELTKPDGQTSRRLESEYLDLYKDFREKHNIKGIEFKTRIEMTGLSTDLALVDATQGNDLKRMNIERKKQFLDDYIELRSKLDNPSTPPEERQLISDYFDAMNGTALEHMSQEYDNIKQDEELAEKDKSKANQILSDIEESLEQSKRLFKESSINVDSILNSVNELMNGRNRTIDIDELQSGLIKLQNASEDFNDSIGVFEKNNQDYEEAVYSGIR